MIRSALVLAIVVASVPFAMAQGTPEERQACTRDAQRFCRQDLGNDGAVQNCLQTNRAKLSKACSRVFESHGM
jgi:Cysteine rich repeat